MSTRLADDVTGMYFLGYSASMVIGISVFVLLFNYRHRAGWLAGWLAGYIWMEQFDPSLVLMLSTTASIGAFVAPKVLSKVRASLVEKVYGPASVVVPIVFGLTLVFRT